MDNFATNCREVKEVYAGCRPEKLYDKLSQSEKKAGGRMSEWDKVFEEMKNELLEQKQQFHIIPKMVLHETENQLG